MWIPQGLTDAQEHACQDAQEKGAELKPYMNDQFLLILPSTLDLGTAFILHDRFDHLFGGIKLHTVDRTRVVYRV